MKAQPSRRNVLVGAGGLVAAALAACTSDAPAAHATAPPGSLIMIIRHAEKPTGSGAPYGVTAEGDKDDESLTVAGWTRAGALIELFDPADASGPAPLRTGLSRPGRIIAANPAHGSARPAETVTPLAARMRLTLDTTWKKGQEDKVAAALDGYSGVSLVAWEHENIQDIIAGLGTVTPTPPSSWPGDRFDLVWTFTRSGDGWTFSQVPQLLLAGDSAKPA